MQGPERNRSYTNASSTPLPATRTGALEGRQIVRYDSRIADPLGFKRMSQLFLERSALFFGRSLEIDKYGRQHLKSYGDRGAICILMGTSSSGKTSIIRALKKEVSGLVETGIDDSADSLRAHSIRKYAPALYERMASAFTHTDISCAVFDETIRWKAGISEEVRATALRAVEEARAIKDSLPKITDEKVHTELYDHVIHESSRGSPVIFDLVNPQDVPSFLEHMLRKHYLAPLKRGLLYCPFPILAEQVRRRNEKALASGNLDDFRVPLMPLEQFCDFFRPAERGETIIDTVRRDQVEAAYASAFNQSVDFFKRQASTNPRDAENLAELTEAGAFDRKKQEILEKLGFTDPSVVEVPLTAKYKSYNYLFRTNVMLPPESSAINRAWK